MGIYEVASHLSGHQWMDLIETVGIIMAGNSENMTERLATHHVYSALYWG